MATRKELEKIETGNIILIKNTQYIFGHLRPEKYYKGSYTVECYSTIGTPFIFKHDDVIISDKLIYKQGNIVIEYNKGGQLIGFIAGLIFSVIGIFIYLYYIK